MKFILFMIFLCLPVWAGLELAAQNRHESRQSVIIETSFDIVAPMMSKDGAWMTIRKRSRIPVWNKLELDKDTVIIFDIRNTEKIRITATRQKIREMAFVGNTHLLLSGEMQTELLNLKEQKGVIFKGVKQIHTLENSNAFLLHYNKDEKSRLEIRDNSGNFLNGTDHVNRFYTTERSHIYAIAETVEKGYEVVLLTDKRKAAIYESYRKIEYLDIDPDENGLMVIELGPDGSSHEVLYLDLKNNMTCPLKEVLPIAIQRGFTEVIREGNVYFVKVLTEKEKPCDTVADIWYGTDNKLEEKFYPPIETLTYVWEPHKHLIRQIGNDHLTTSINMGNDRYFLSFDSYHFQDYTAESTPLQVYVYDRVQDRYSLLDTIAPEVYLSGNGTYVISPEDKAWQLYHIPSGSKKLVTGNGLGTPWFTDDGNTVWFEGEGALWKYELKSGILTEAAVFKGYQTSIINGERDGTSTGKGRFSKSHVNLLKPLLIKLYDSLKNVTSYVLWHNGKTEIIIPPTASYIQYLNYDDTYKHFSYMEEDYNMPPRMVYKTIAKSGKLIYQSNKEDKDILSLKQEIIRYTNNEGIPLKGILYYPLHYTSSQNYPMVVHIYEKQSHLANRYPYPSYYDDLGFNIRLLLEKGYFVYLPDILMQGKDGPGMKALACVNNALDALSENPLIDKYNIGLIGHSFGGYETDFIATHSERFAAYVSGSGISDVIHMYNSFNYNFQWPDYMRVETGQLRMGMPFTNNKTKYMENNPIYYAEKVNAPVLLWTGTEDKNVTPDHSMAFYNALRRNKKDVIALFYKDEGHSLRQQQAQIDLTSRILDWFDYFLRNDTRIEWIGKGLN